jgi:hypothetical protein
MVENEKNVNIFSAAKEDGVLGDALSRNLRAKRILFCARAKSAWQGGLAVLTTFRREIVKFLWRIVHNHVFSL